MFKLFSLALALALLLPNEVESGEELYEYSDDCLRVRPRAYAAGCNQACIQLAELNPDLSLSDFNDVCYAGTTAILPIPPRGRNSLDGESGEGGDRELVEELGGGPRERFEECPCSCQTCVIAEVPTVDSDERRGLEEGSPSYNKLEVLLDIMKESSKTEEKEGRDLILFDFFDWLFGLFSDDPSPTPNPTPAPTYERISIVDRECLFFDPFFPELLPEIDPGENRFCANDDLWEPFFDLFFGCDVCGCTCCLP